MAAKFFKYLLLCWLVLLVCIQPTKQHKECRARHTHYCKNPSNQQLDHLQICDNVKDCPGGEDEANCGFPLVEGSVWKADVQYDNCTAAHGPEDITMTIVHVDRSGPGSPKIEADVILAHTHDEQTVFEAKSDGHYCFANRLLSLATNNDQSLMVRCCFDEGHLDECHGALHLGKYAMSDWHPCAEFVYRRIDTSSGERLITGVVYKSALFVVALMNFAVVMN